MTSSTAVSKPVVIRMSRIGLVLVVLVYLPLSVLIAFIAFAYATSDEATWGRIVAGVVAALAVLQIPWFIRGARPRRHRTLELELDDRAMTGRQDGEVTFVPRREVWFVQVNDVTPASGVVFVGAIGRDGQVLAGWRPNWGLNVSSIKVRRSLSRAGYPWVLVVNGKVWSSEGVGPEARPFLDLPS